MIEIEVSNLVKQYKGVKFPSVDNISFTVAKGEFFAFLGPNGAGKTTTISILTTTLSKTSGEIKIAGFDIDSHMNQVREKIGIIFQKPSLDPQLTAEENMRFHTCLYGMYGYRPTFKLMPIAYRQRVMDLAEVMGVQDALFKPVKKLSGGMQRKLEIIRSMIHRPEVLFLDEPTQGLDAVSRRGLWDYINDMRNEYGTTIFFTSHYIEEAEHADKVCIINSGRIVAYQPPEKMKQNFLKRELVLDSDNNNALIAELSEMRLTYHMNVKGQIIVPFYEQTAQRLISKLKTPLSTLEIHEPTLEDAYISFLNKSGV